MSKLLWQVNVKLRRDQKEALELISEFEGKRGKEGQGTLVREWIQDKIEEYQEDPKFQKFLKFIKGRK